MTLTPADVDRCVDALLAHRLGEAIDRLQSWDSEDLEMALLDRHDEKIEPAELTQEESDAIADRMAEIVDPDLSPRTLAADLAEHLRRLANARALTDMLLREAR